MAYGMFQMEKDCVVQCYIHVRNMAPVWNAQTRVCTRHAELKGASPYSTGVLTMKHLAVEAAAASHQHL